MLFFTSYTNRIFPVLFSGGVCVLLSVYSMFSRYVVLSVLQALIYQDGNLLSGSVEALIQHLVPTAKYYPDVSTLLHHVNN